MTVSVYYLDLYLVRPGILSGISPGNIHVKILEFCEIYLRAFAITHAYYILRQFL